MRVPIARAAARGYLLARAMLVTHVEPHEPSIVTFLAQPSPQRVPRDWPVLAALGGVVILVLGTIGVDLVVARRVARRTAEIVENSQRSIELVDDLRAQVHRLADLSGNTPELLAITRRIAADARDYDPLATSKGEREEWNYLQEKLALLPLLGEAKDAAGTRAPAPPN